jgi:D-alanyl-D-alanine carboxypeptidase
MTFFSGLRPFFIGLVAMAMAATAATRADAEAKLLIEAATGKVLMSENATYPWYPASVTKLMTTYTTLRAIRQGRITLDTLLTISRNAVAQQPTKMGFPVGTQVTVDNALKMLLVKSANDIAVAVAEGVGGSITGFADMMNANARRLGMSQSHFVNPNGLPADNHVSSARDLAILARALIREFPQYDSYWHIHSIRYGKRIIRNYNSLLDRYPGADGMKTGFICASGYNLVASATRNGRRLIAVVLGAYSGNSRAQEAAELLERGFNSGALSWLTPSLGTVDALKPIVAEPPNLRDEICGKHRRARTDHASEEEETPAGREGDSTSSYASVLGGRTIDKASLLVDLPPSGPPVVVHVIPPPGAPTDPDALMARNAKKKGRVAISKGKHGRKTAVIAVGHGTTAKPVPHKPVAAKGAADAKPAGAAAKPHAKPAAAKHATPAKPAAAAAAKPKGAAKPAAAAKPKTDPKAKPKAARAAAAAQ